MPRIKDFEYACPTIHAQYCRIEDKKKVGGNGRFSGSSALRFQHLILLHLSKIGQRDSRDKVTSECCNEKEGNGEKRPFLPKR